MKYFFRVIPMFLVILAMPTSMVHAGSLDVSPVRITLDGQQPIAAVTVHNRGSEASVIQVEVLRWERLEGRDVHTPTRELLVNPPVFTVMPGQPQIMRIGLNRPADKTGELAYRVYLQEVPAAPTPGFTGLRMALRLGLPVFVLPEAPAASTLHWSVKRQADRAFRVVVTNTGNAHARVQDIKLSTQRESGRVIAAHPAQAYLFPGQTAEWRMEPAWNWEGDRAFLCVLSDQGLANTDVEIE